MSAPDTPAERLALIKHFDQGCITQGLRLLPIIMDSIKARAMLLKIGLQEGRLFYRDQLERNGKNTVLGPALSPWQFERGGIRGLMRHPATRDHLRALCRVRGLPYATEAVWKRMASDDPFAAAVARLNLYWYHMPLPAVDDCWGSWAQYEAIWRPGKPHPETWETFHNEVVAYLAGKS